MAPLAVELAPIRINAVSPGFVDTPWWSGMPDDARQEYFAENHLQRLMKPIQQVRVRRVRPVTGLVHLDDVGPVPEAARQFGLLASKTNLNQASGDC